MKPAAIVLHGPTSAGKSSLARALQDSAQVPSYHVALDAFVTMSRRRDMRSPEEQRLAYRLHCENLRSTLARLLDTQFEIIVDLVLRDAIELGSWHGNVGLFHNDAVHFRRIGIPRYWIQFETGIWWQLPGLGQPDGKNVLQGRPLCLRTIQPQIAFITTKFFWHYFFERRGRRSLGIL